MALTKWIGNKQLSCEERAKAYGSVWFLPTFGATIRPNADAYFREVGDILRIKSGNDASAGAP